jgi:site-specific recombinase XerD
MEKKKISFLMKDPDADRSPLILKYTCDNGALKYPLGLTMIRLRWDFTEQEPFNPLNTDRKLVDAIRTRMNELKESVGDYIHDCKIKNKKILKEELKAYLKMKDRKVKDPDGSSFFDHLQKLIFLAETGEFKKKKKAATKGFSEGTIVNWVKLKNKLKEFNKDLTFENITVKTCEQFISFLTKKDFSDNYIGNFIKDFKAIMSHTYRLGWHQNTVQKEFPVINELTSDIYLTEEDIEKLKKVELSGMQEVIRDRFIAGFRTGLRISDWANFEEKAKIHNGVAMLVNQKTKKVTPVPLSSEYYEMLEKYGGKLPRQYNSIVANRHIKLIAKKAGLTDPVLMVTTKGGKTVEQWFEKWEVISHHTARRSAASLLLEAGVSSIDVENVLGMSAQTVRRYDKRKKQKIAEDMKTLPFYNRKNGDKKGTDMLTITK